MKGLVEKAHGMICQNSDSNVSYRKKDGFRIKTCMTDMDALTSLSCIIEERALY